MNLQELFTANELSELLGVSSRTIFSWKKERGLPFVKLGPRLIRYDFDSIEIWLESQEK